ncbi:MAG: TolC family outer membrane protein [Rhodospirillaceae bacterium]|nr:TolC family outer membrane protein [Rhodospirillaceae bacterium]MBT5944234.1 TolC family outer membrane protein [Rhodospirillaceae bacterium]MBT6403960.1 TolC family outer membrane protein [Rhodospirillaceae bacterium]MBT7361384.1 TolC family outer membrane protein [Rhodospirillaceae bacterium]
MNLRYGLSAVAVLAFLGVSATTADAENLREALAQTYETNPDLASERAGLRATDESVPQALSNWRPEIEIDSSYGLRKRDRDFNSTAADIENTDQVQSISLGVSQNLFRGFRTIAESDSARNRVAAGRADLIDTEQSILLEAVTAYINVVRDRVILSLRENNVRVLEQERQATADRFEVGELTRTDVAQADSRLAESVSQRTEAQGNLSSSRADYLEVIGTIPGDLVRPELPAGLPPSEQSAVLQAKTNNPSVVAQDFNERADRDRVDLAAGELLPTLTLDGELEKNKDVLGSDTVTSEQSVTLNLTVPLYQAGDVYSRVREAKQTANQSLLALAEEERQAQEAARRSWADLTSASSRIVSGEAEVAAQEIAFEGVQQEAQVGSRTVLDVLDAEQELLDSRVDLVVAQRDQIVAAYQLLQAIGRLTAEDLDLPVAIYDPTRNFRDVEDRLFGSDILDGN